MNDSWVRLQRTVVCVAYISTQFTCHSLFLTKSRGEASGVLLARAPVFDLGLVGVKYTYQQSWEYRMKFGISVLLAVLPGTEIPNTISSLCLLLGILSITNYHSMH